MVSLRAKIMESGVERLGFESWLTLLLCGSGRHWPLSLKFVICKMKDVIPYGLQAPSHIRRFLNPPMRRKVVSVKKDTGIVEASIWWIIQATQSPSLPGSVIWKERMLCPDAWQPVFVPSLLQTTAAGSLVLHEPYGGVQMLPSLYSVLDAWSCHWVIRAQWHHGRAVRLQACG